MRSESVTCSRCEREIKGFRCECGFARWRPLDGSGYFESSSKTHLLMRFKDGDGSMWVEAPKGALAVLETRKAK